MEVPAGSKHRQSHQHGHSSSLLHFKHLCRVNAVKSQLFLFILDGEFSLISWPARTELPHTGSWLCVPAGARRDRSASCLLSVSLAEKSVHFSSIAEAQKLSAEPTAASCWPPVLSYSRDVIKTSPQAEPHLFQYNPPGK